MRNAAGSRVRVGHVRHFGYAAGVQQVEDRHDRVPAGVKAEKAVPECAARDGGDLHSIGVNLAMQFIQTIDDQFRQFLRIDFRAAIGSGADLIRNARAIAFDLFGFAIKQQRAHRGASNVEAYNEEIRGVCSARAGAQSHHSL